MPTKLKGLRIKRVALVDEGANPDAHITFAKAKDAPEPADEERVSTKEFASAFHRFSEVVDKFFHGNNIKKDAFTFADTEGKRNYEKLLADEVYPSIWAFMDSVESIFKDDEKSDSEKEALLKQSVSEFSEMFSNSSGQWSKGEQAQTGIKKDETVLVKMRDAIDAVIRKEADSGEEQPNEDESDNDGRNEEGSDDQQDGQEEPPVEKGATDMKIDVSKMSAEERAQYEDLVKRFGVQEDPGAEEPSNPAPVPAQHSVPAAVDDDEDMYKGISPAVKAEIEALRKFKASAEEHELTELAKRYEIIGKKPEELLPVFKSLKAVGEDAFKQFVATLDSAVSTIEKSGVFGEVGKRGTSTNPDDAWGKIETIARDIMKSKPEMKWPEAVDAACMAHPDLVDQYEKSRH